MQFSSRQLEEEEEEEEEEKALPGKERGGGGRGVWSLPFFGSGFPESPPPPREMKWYHFGEKTRERKSNLCYLRKR